MIDVQQAAQRQQQARLFLSSGGKEGSNPYYPYDLGHDFIQDTEALAAWAAEHLTQQCTELPMRIQRQRRKGWKAPPNTVSVCRPGPFGNPWTVEWARLSGLLRDGAEAFACVSNYRAWLEYSDEKRAEFAACFGEHEERRKRLMELLPTLRGKNLMCFCRLCDEHKDGRPLGVECDKCEPCHIDPLLEFANR